MRRRFGLVVAGLIALGVAWMFATPQWQAPDEAAQYLRALTITRGHLVGPKVGIDPQGKAVLAEGTWHAQEERWILHDRRGVEVTPAMSPPGETCVDGLPDTGGCQEASYTGDYFPPGYLLPAAAISTQSTASGGLWAARGASLIQTLLFLALAVALTGAGLGLLGLALGITPALLFIGAALNPSGLELAAGIALLAGLLRFARDPAGFPAWAWVATVLSGVVTIVSWQLGPVFAICDVLVIAVLISGRQARAAVAQRARWSSLAAALLVAAIVAFAIYGALAGATHATISFTHPGTDISLAWQQLGPTLRGAVGTFGEYDIPLPAWMPDVWVVLSACLWLLGVAVGDWRERAALALAALLALAVPIAFYALVQRNSGFGLQGRYALLLFALIPLVGCAVLERHRGTRVSRATAVAAPAVGVAVAACELIAWWVDARHWAGSTFFSGAAVTPPGGWWPWAACAIVGSVLLAAGLVLRRGQPATSAPAGPAVGSA